MSEQNADIRRLEKLSRNALLLTSWEVNFCWECTNTIQQGGELTPGQRTKLMEIEDQRLH